MSIPRRYGNPYQIASNDRTFFVTSSILDKRQRLQSDILAKLFFEVLYHYRSLGKFLLHEFVVMPDHFHLLVTVDRTITIEKAVQFINGGFACRAHKEQGVTSPCWQKGFSEVRVLSFETYANFKSYIYQNPVKRGLAVVAEEYWCSAAHEGFELGASPFENGARRSALRRVSGDA